MRLLIGMISRIIRGEEGSMAWSGEGRRVGRRNDEDEMERKEGSSRGSTCAELAVPSVECNWVPVTFQTLITML